MVKEAATIAPIPGGALAAELALDAGGAVVALAAAGIEEAATNAIREHDEHPTITWAADGVEYCIDGVWHKVVGPLTLTSLVASGVPFRVANSISNFVSNQGERFTDAVITGAENRVVAAIELADGIAVRTSNGIRATTDTITHGVAHTIERVLDTPHMLGEMLGFTQDDALTEAGSEHRGATPAEIMRDALSNLFFFTEQESETEESDLATPVMQRQETEEYHSSSQNSDVATDAPDILDENDDIPYAEEAHHNSGFLNRLFGVLTSDAMLALTLEVFYAGVIEAEGGAKCTSKDLI